MGDKLLIISGGLRRVARGVVTWAGRCLRRDARRVLGRERAAAPAS